MPNARNMSSKEKKAASDAAEAAIAAEAVAAASSVAVNLTAIKAPAASIAAAWAASAALAEHFKARRFDFIASAAAAVPTLDSEAQAAVDDLAARAEAKEARFKAWAAKKAAVKARRMAPIKEEKGRGGKKAVVRTRSSSD